MKDKILKKAFDYAANVQKIRHHLHQFPELSFEEHHTARYISDILTEWGIAHTTGIVNTGIVATIQGRPSKKTIALRADIDALPILEKNEVAYKSRNQGIMHACGHDVHAASLLGTVKILHELRHAFSGNVRFIFQPGEEKLPGGASLMIKEGVLRNPKPVGIFGQHVFPSMEVGKVGFRAGMYMASADELYLTIRGKGGHGATPHQCVDTVAITAQIIVALQQLVSRYANPIVPSVLTFGKMNSQGGATNIIPNTVQLEGTFRTMDEAWRSDAHRKILQMATGIAKSMGASCEVNILKGYPVLFNDVPLTQKAQYWATELLGKENVEELPLRMTAEDFAWYSHVVPACFYRLGTGNSKKGITSPVHTDTFDIDEEALPIGSALMAYLAVQRLGE